MSAILFGLFSVALILVSLFMVLVILMQRASANSGMGASLGGGAAESALGAGAGNALTKATRIAAIAFFLISFGLYLGFLAQADNQGPANTLPTEITTPEDAAATEEAADDDPLVKLPEGMDFSATAKQQAQQQAETQTVEGEQGAMSVTTVPTKEEAEAAVGETTGEAPEAASDKSETNAQ